MSMKFVVLLAVLVRCASAADASDLPACPTEGIRDNCFGTYTYANGATYVGEWKDDRMNRQGTYTSADRTIREGIWKDGKFLGTVAEVERAERARIAKEEQEELAKQAKQDKYERTYTACLLDKAADVDMSVSSLEKALKATCASIAEDPSIIETFRYN